MPSILNGDEKGIKEAARLIGTGRQVVLPTETVYGLAANALDGDAVAEIFTIKGRPATNPLIVHVASTDQARSLGEFNNRASILASTFWPGPLSIVVNAYDVIPENVTAGGTTVALRMPSHPLILRVIELACLPIAAPSANKSEGISPTTVADVIVSLGDKSPAILDGGTCTVGIESTVVDVSAAAVKILRPGAISRLQIERALGEPVEIGGSSGIARSPGQMKRHYAPTTPARLVSSAELVSANLTGRALLYYSQIQSAPSCSKAIQLPNSPAEYAAKMYAALHELDRAGTTEIIVEAPPENEEWAAVRDRLSRAVAY